MEPHKAGVVVTDGIQSCSGNWCSSAKIFSIVGGIHVVGSAPCQAMQVSLLLNVPFRAPSLSLPNHKGGLMSISEPLLKSGLLDLIV